MTTNILPSYYVWIYMAGDVSEAKRICNKFCKNVGLCVTVEPLTYIYTGGQEEGFRIGLIRYPRFPEQNEKDIWTKAQTLATDLQSEMNQQSFLIMDNKQTTWYTERS